MRGHADCGCATRRRFLALWFQNLPTERHRLSRGSAAPAEPLVLVARDRQAMRLAAVCGRARALGLRPGLTLADARARLPDLHAAPADPAADARLLGLLARQAARWSSQVMIDAPDGLILETGGSAHLFGGEAGLIAAVQARFGRWHGFGWAFASSPAAARALARHGAGGSPADEAAAVRALPVAALELDPPATRALRRAGLKRIGDLVTLPRAPLAARFGAGALLALDRLLGRAEPPGVPLRAAPALAFAERPAEPLLAVAGALAVLEALLGRAARALARRGAGGRRFVARLCRTDGATAELAVETGRPTRDPALVMRLFAERIEGLSDPLDPGFGYDLVRLEVPVTEPLAAASLRLDTGPDGASGLAELVARLGARHGRGRILRPVPVDTHVPERAVRLRPAIEGAAPWPADGRWSGLPRPILLFEPPQPVEAIAEVPDGPPRRFRWRGCLHDVAKAEGPERIAAPWWQRASRNSPTRDYYRVEDRDGRRFWLFRRGLHGREPGIPRWYLHGLFA